MYIQSILSLAIGVIFMGFVSLVFVDFVNGLFWLPYSYSAIAPVATTNQVIAAPEPQFAQLPDPWLSTDILPTAIQQEPVVLQFPTLKLLPSAAQVQPTTTKPKSKTTKPKSASTSKSSKRKTTVTPRKPRQKSA